MSKRLVKNYYKFDRVICGQDSKSSLSTLDLDKLSEYQIELRRLRASIPSAEQFINSQASTYSLSGWMENWANLMSYLATVSVFVLVATQSTLYKTSETAPAGARSPAEFQVVLKQVGKSGIAGRMLNIEVRAPGNGSFYAVVVEKKGSNSSLIFPDSMRRQVRLAFLPVWNLPAMIFSHSTESNESLFVVISDRPIEMSDFSHAEKNVGPRRITLENGWIEIHGVKIN